MRELQAIIIAIRHRARLLYLDILLCCWCVWCSSSSVHDFVIFLEFVLIVIVFNGTHRIARSFQVERS